MKNNKNKRCVIIAAAPINNYEKIKKVLTKDDYYIACDAGINHCQKLSVTPNLIIGDFDSATKPDTPIETIQLPTEKDDSDSFYAAKIALQKGFKNFVLIGAVGARLDHTLVNISILEFLNANGCQATIIDDYSKIQIVKNKTITVDKNCTYFSTITLDSQAQLSLTNAKYPLTQATIERTFQYGLSNEIKTPPCKLTVTQGAILLIEVF